MKKILIVSYYWPPAGGPGVQRWLKFTKYLPEYGYEPFVYIPENPSYPILDDSLKKEISTKIKILKNRIWEPYQIAEKISKKNKDYKAGQFETEKKEGLISQLSVFIRGNFFIPDARKFWIQPSINFLEKFLNNHEIDYLVTTGPPHSMHLIGLGLKERFPLLKWIADFRDPWTQISYYSQLKLTSWADKKHKFLEKKVLQKADLILSTSYTDKVNFEKLGAKKVSCITNGFDSESQINLPSSSLFILSYVGMLETLRNPTNLWEVLQDILLSNENFKKDFRLRFVGKIADSILENIKHSSLKDHTTILGYVSHEEAILEMNQSNLLLITNFPEEKSKGIIPGKLFEYLATNKTILSLGYKDSDVKKILQETQAGEHFTFDDYDKLKSFILDEYLKWKNNLPTNKVYSTQKYHRKELTKKLVECLEELEQ